MGAGAAVVTASGVFGEMQSALNKVWEVHTPRSGIWKVVKNRLSSLGMIAVFGFVLMISMGVSAGLAAWSGYIDARFGLGSILLLAITEILSFIIFVFIFSAMYKLLPDYPISWRDVVLGAAITSGMFMIGKTLISLYLASSDVSSAYGTAGTFLLVLLWIFYSVEIFLLGAEITREVARDEWVTGKTRVTKK